MAGEKSASQESASRVLQGLKGATFDSNEPTDEKDEDLDGEIKGSGEEGEEKEEGTGEEEAGQDTLDPENAGADADSEKEFLNGMQVVKQENGEYISKAAFLKRLKKESERFKKAEADRVALDQKFKPYQDKAAHYQDWDQNHEKYKEAVAFASQLGTVIRGNSWLTPILGSLLAGKPVPWAEVAPHIRPFMDQFKAEEEDPDAPRQDPRIMTELQKVRERQEAFEQGQIKKEQEAQAKAESEVNRAKLNKEFSEQLSRFSEKYKPYAKPVYRDIILDRAAAIAEANPNAPINLVQIGEDLIKELNADKLAEQAAAKAAAEKKKKAGVESGGGPTGFKPKPTDEVGSDGYKKGLIGRIASRFGSDLT